MLAVSLRSLSKTGHPSCLIWMNHYAVCLWWFSEFWPWRVVPSPLQVFGTFLWQGADRLALHVLPPTGEYTFYVVSHSRPPVVLASVVTRTSACSISAS